MGADAGASDLCTASYREAEGILGYLRETGTDGTGGDP